MNVVGALATFTSRVFDDEAIQNPHGLLSRFKKSGGYLALNKIIGFAIPFAARAGFEVTELRRGHLKARIPLKGNTNHINSMYAGALFTLAEIPGGVMAIYEFGADYYPTLKEMNIKYYLPVKSDAFVQFDIAEEEMERIIFGADADGKCDYTLIGKVFDAEGQLVAETENYYQLRRKDYKSPQAR
ncbi:PaaI family thioesterase [Hahella ganghwensis]|uniref:PaaI family thioesterase n=1 Tax=Hahella ganghwensis TaxID=286420 RepID=UPI000364273F|nr:YiiD C-terminal domain-containing protein [Hahella ganghwensis]